MLRQKVLLVCASVALIAGLLFGFECYRQGLFLFAGVDFFMCGLMVLVWAFSLKNNESALPGVIMVTSSSLFFFYLFASGGVSGVGPVWSLVVPLIAFFLTGFRTGILISSVYLVGCIGVLVFNEYYPGYFYAHEAYFMKRFFGVFGLIAIISGGYEYHKSQMEKMLLELFYATQQDQEKIARSEIRYRALFEGSGQAIIIADAHDAMVIEANPAAGELFGYNHAEFKGKAVKNFHGPEIADKALELFKKNLFPGRSMISQLPCMRADGTTFYSDLFTTVIELDGRPCVVGFFSDVTERVQSERELNDARKAADAANEAKGYFLANISHEIRTPLNGIIGITELLCTTNLDDEQRKFAGIIRQCGDSLLSLICDVLDFSKIESGKMDIENQPFDLLCIINEVFETMQIKTAQKQLEFKLELAGQLPARVVGDSLRFRQVLNNLIDNAIKFTGNGSVIVKVSSNGEKNEKHDLLFEVIDTGIGVSEEKLPFLFKSFSQLDSSTTRVYGGTGLGLAISRKLAHLMGGDIGVFSTHGKGSNFWFNIPFNVAGINKSEQSEEIHEKSHEKLSGSMAEAVADKDAGDSCQILLADDNSTNFLVVQAMLNKLNVKVELVENGHEVILALARKKYHLVLLDLHMPLLDGFETFAFIQRNLKEGVGYAVPVIAMTADAFSETREACFKAGMSDFISKPFNMQELIAIVKKWLPKSS